MLRWAAFRRRDCDRLPTSTAARYFQRGGLGQPPMTTAGAGNPPRCAGPAIAVAPSASGRPRTWTSPASASPPMSEMPWSRCRCPASPRRPVGEQGKGGTHASGWISRSQHVESRSVGALRDLPGTAVGRGRPAPANAHGSIPNRPTGADVRAIHADVPSRTRLCPPESVDAEAGGAYPESHPVMWGYGPRVGEARSWQ